MSSGLKLRRVAAGFALAVSVLAPAAVVIGNAAPASAAMSLLDMDDIVLELDICIDCPAGNSPPRTANVPIRFDKPGK